MVLFIYGNKRHGLPATGSHCNFEHIGRSHGPFFDAIVFGILRRIRSVGIDRCSISHTGLQEAEFLGQCPGLIVRAGAQEETVIRTAYDDNIFAGFTLQCFGPVTVGIEIPEELESRMSLVVFDRTPSEAENK